MGLARCDVKAALVAAVTAEVASFDPKPVVQWASPREPETGDYITFGPAVSGNDEVPTIRVRPVSLDDEWSMEVACVAWTPGTYDPETTDRRCEALMGAVVDSVRANPSVPAGGACVESITVQSADGPAYGVTDIGGFSVGVVTITCKQRIS